MQPEAGKIRLEINPVLRNRERTMRIRMERNELVDRIDLRIRENPSPRITNRALRDK